MSLGFYRLGRPNRLKSVRLAEVSVVDKASCPGTKIQFLKRDDERNEPMESTTTVMKQFSSGEFHKGMHNAVQLRKSGAIGRDAYDKIFKHAAAVAYPLAKQAEAERQFILTPLGERMINEGLAKDHEDLQRDSARANASLVAKSKKPKVHLEQPDDREPDDDPDDELQKLGEMYRRAHPKAQFTKAQAVAWVGQHTPEGRRLVLRSKQKNLSAYGSKFAGFFDKAQSAVSRTPPLTQPDVVRDPADRAEFDAGQAAVESGRRTPDGGTFNERVKELMSAEGISEIEAMSRLVGEAREERIAKLGW